ncbi:hypothetical protein [Pengzhenrongella sicca]|uniref:Uncharacterized protein n=1 Tax=Pengzhenrongella sicca TaxID=2819238 RepID=A0A8A4ZH73_9MICO|nr:hypothetical protein [Pengzhenrongella sicca]QTE30329.1 hypothetical protein J4E96_04835 [Pengzhenrongella sicca]
MVVVTLSIGLAGCSAGPSATDPASAAPAESVHVPDPTVSNVPEAQAALVRLPDIPTCGQALRDHDAYTALVNKLLKDTSDLDYVNHVVFESENVCGSLEDSPVTDALLQSGLTRDDLNVDWNSTGDAPSGPAAEHDSAPGEDCATVMISSNQSGEGTVSKAAHEVTPPTEALPDGVAFPQAPSCALELTGWDDTVGRYVIWEGADFDALHTALLNAGWADGDTTWTSEDGTQRKFMLTTPGGGLGWLDSGQGVMAGIAPSTVMLVYPL